MCNRQTLDAHYAIYQPEFRSARLIRSSRNRCRTSPYNFTVVAYHVCSCSPRSLLLSNFNLQELHFKHDCLEPPCLFSILFFISDYICFGSCQKSMQVIGSLKRNGHFIVHCQKRRCHIPCDCLDTTVLVHYH